MTTSPSLTPARAAQLLRASIATLRAEAEALGAEGTAWRPAPDEWCFNEVVGHLIEADERGFAGRIRRILEQPGRTDTTWDPVAVARERRDCERDSLALTSELEALREDGLRTLEGLREEQLTLSCEHPAVGRLRIVDVLHEWVHHDRNHVKQALSNAQAYVWPHMANAQCFSEID